MTPRLGKRQREELLTRKWGYSEPENAEKKVPQKFLDLGLVDLFEDDSVPYLTCTGELVCSLLREIDRTRSEATKQGYDFAKDKW